MANPVPSLREADRLVRDQGDQRAATAASVASAGNSRAAGRVRAGAGAHNQPLPIERTDVAEAKEDVRNEVERNAAAERHRRTVSSGSPTWAERLLDPDGEEDDARDHRQVEVAVRVAGHRELRVPGRLAQPALGDERDDVEVRPPQRRRDGEAEQRGRDDTGVEHGRADADRHDRLAQGDDHDQAVTLGEVTGGEPPTLATPNVGTEQVQRERERPDGDLRPPSRPAATKRSPMPSADPTASLATAWSRSRSPRPAIAYRTSGRSGRTHRRRRTGTRRPRTRPGLPGRRSASPPSRRT